MKFDMRVFTTATHLIHLVFSVSLEFSSQKTLELVLPVKLQSAINYIKTIKTRFFDYKLNFLFFTFSYLFISLNIVNELADFTGIRTRIIY